jgi:hypothetical protein
MEYFDRVPRLVWRDPKKNEVLPSRRFATFAAKQILETLLGASWEGKKRYLDEKVAGNDRRRPERANRGEDDAPVSREPVSLADSKKSCTCGQWETCHLPESVYFARPVRS